jgi:hypothetical protein
VRVTGVGAAYDDRHLSERAIWSYLIQIAQGLEHIHRRRILHRDIKVPLATRVAVDVAVAVHQTWCVCVRVCLRAVFAFAACTQRLKVRGAFMTTRGPCVFPR